MVRYKCRNVGRISAANIQENRENVYAICRIESVVKLRSRRKVPEVFAADIWKKAVDENKIVVVQKKYRRVRYGFTGKYYKIEERNTK